MHTMLPVDLALLGIAMIFYTWRDLYLPGVRKLEMLRERAVLRKQFMSHLWADTEHKTADQRTMSV